MVTLKNIKKGNKIISADYYPEDSTEPGYIVVDLETEEIILNRSPKEHEKYYSYSWYTRYARYGLLEVAKSGKIPEKKVVMWY